MNDSKVLTLICILFSISTVFALYEDRLRYKYQKKDRYNTQRRYDVDAEDNNDILGHSFALREYIDSVLRRKLDENSLNDDDRNIYRSRNDYDDRSRGKKKDYPIHRFDDAYKRYDEPKPRYKPNYHHNKYSTPKKTTHKPSYSTRMYSTTTTSTTPGTTTQNVPGK